MIKQYSLRLFFLLFASILLAGCGPEVGSPEWCAATKAKPKGDWSSNDLADFTKHCIFK